MSKIEEAKKVCRQLASEHYGSTMFFDEDKMLAALKRRGYSEKTAADAIIAVQSKK